MLHSAADVFNYRCLASLATHGAAPVKAAPTFFHHRLSFGHEPTSAAHDVTPVRIRHAGRRKTGNGRIAPAADRSRRTGTLDGVAKVG